MEFEKKEGCGVLMELACVDEDGKCISDIPKGGWYGFNRADMNALSLDLTESVIGVLDKYNVATYGPEYRKPKGKTV